MKKIIPIQSISDVITNSSSEVYLMDLQDALKVDYVKKFGDGKWFWRIKEITKDWILTLDGDLDGGGFEENAELLMLIASIPYEEFNVEEMFWEPDTGLEYWKAFVNDNWDKYFSNIIGKCVFEVSDEDTDYDYLVSIVEDIKKHGGQHLDGRNFMEGLCNI